MNGNIFVLKKTVNWSFLTNGFTIAMEERGLFNLYMKDILLHGQSKDIYVRIEGELYKARLNNINFNQDKWGEHTDVIQVKYSKSSEISKKLRSIFSVSYQYLYEKKQAQTNKRQHLILPAEISEYFVLSATEEPYVFELDCFTVNDVQELAHTVSILNEEEFESLESDEKIADRISRMIDKDASIVERQRIIKVRKIDRSVIDNLKYIYDNHCQICGEKIGEEFGKCVIEAHHIDYFTHSQNNDASNIIVISPNYHRIIHQNNPHFNPQTKCFEFDNGTKLGLKLNKHL